MKMKKNLKELLNLGIVDYTNLTSKHGNLDLPYICSNVIPEVDYFANYSQPSTYFQTEHTCVSFFEYDKTFDGLYGLWNAIYHNIKELQQFYINRFDKVLCFVSPDFSKVGDAPEEENRYRQFKMRICSVWLTMNTNATVIPLVSCANQYSLSYMLDGMDDCKVVAFNAKGPMHDPVQLNIFKEAIKYTVDHLHKLEVIYVYSASPNISKVNDIFKYAIDAGIDVRIPDNMLQTRNRILGGDYS